MQCFIRVELFYSDFVSGQAEEVKGRIKKAWKKTISSRIAATEAILTETNQAQGKIALIEGSFDLEKFINPEPPWILEWGCGLFVMNGHHRLIAASNLGLTVPVNLSRYE